MSEEPAFPAEAFGKGPESYTPPAAATPSATPAGEDRPAASGGEASATEALAAAKAVKGKLWPAAGVAIGIGSAAVAAALLYRSRR